MKPWVLNHCNGQEDDVARRHRRINLSAERISRLLKQKTTHDPAWQFVRDVFGLIWEYKWYGLAIFAVTIFQEFAALWPVNPPP